MRAAMLPAAVALLAVGAGHAAARHYDLEHPVRDCQPCIFSPGPGAPDFEIVFKFEDMGPERQLVALSVHPAGGGVARVFDLPEPLASKDFPDGFYLLDDDLNFDGYRDLGLALAPSIRAMPAIYWVYDPEKRRLVTFERVGDDNSDARLVRSSDGSKELFAHEPSSAIEHVDFWYRVSGATATAVRRERQFEQGGAIVRLLEDLTADPPRLLARSTGFLDEDERRAFLRRAETAARQSGMLYRAGDKAAAAAGLKSLLADKILESLYDKPGNTEVSRLLNDYGFYLDEAGDPKDAVEVLNVVVAEDPDRAAAYLNIADAQFALGRLPAARANYRRYRELMTRDGKADAVPPRVRERSQ